MSFCPFCNEPVWTGDDVCDQCGLVLTSVSVASGGAVTVAPPKKAAPAHGRQGAATPCPVCGDPLDPGAKVCDGCGVEVAKARRATPAPVPPPAPAPAPVSASSPCPVCGDPLPAGSKLCTSCGVEITRATVAALAKQEPPPAAPAQRCPACGNTRRGTERFCRQCGHGYDHGSPTASSAAPRPASERHRLPSGAILGSKYRIVQPIGTGGMGAVYLAEDMVLKRSVVIKTLVTSDDAQLAAQSIKEREFLATLKHSNLVSIYDFFSLGNEGYIVMEYVQGKTLFQIMEEHGGPLAVGEAIRYVLGILPAFTYLARLNLVYCDFKPQNVILEVLKDGTQLCKLIDLGTVIECVPEPADVFGTEGYYAPEAVSCPTPETDLYSICRTLAQMVTWMEMDTPKVGLPPAGEYPVFQEHPVLYRLLHRGTHPDPARRFASAEELGDQLAGVLRQLVGGVPGVPVSSRLFLSGGVGTAPGRLGLRAATVLDEQDKAIDLLRHGDQALWGGNPTNALGYYSQAVSSNPKSLDGHLRLADLYLERGDFTQALSHLAQAQRIVPTHWKLAWYRARLLEAQNDLDAASAQYISLMGELPGELPPTHALARVRARQGNDQGAVDLYRTILRADPHNTEAILGMAHSLIRLRQWEEATRVLASISPTTARYAEAQLLLCDLLLHHIQPPTVQNIQRAAAALATLHGRTQDPRYFLARGDLYRMARRLVREKVMPSNTLLAGVPDAHPATLGREAEAAYVQYLRREPHAANREEILRRRFEVAPWRWW